MGLAHQQLAVPETMKSPISTAESVSLPRQHLNELAGHVRPAHPRSINASGYFFGRGVPPGRAETLV
jgi:hypothetical protein